MGREEATAPGAPDQGQSSRQGRGWADLPGRGVNGSLRFVLRAVSARRGLGWCVNLGRGCRGSMGQGKGRVEASSWCPQRAPGERGRMGQAKKGPVGSRPLPANGSHRWERAADGQMQTSHQELPSGLLISHQGLSMGSAHSVGDWRCLIWEEKPWPPRPSTEESAPLCMHPPALNPGSQAHSPLETCVRSLATQGVAALRRPQEFESQVRQNRGHPIGEPHSLQ